MWTLEWIDQITNEPLWGAICWGLLVSCHTSTIELSAVNCGQLQKVCRLKTRWSLYEVIIQLKCNHPFISFHYTANVSLDFLTIFTVFYYFDSWDWTSTAHLWCYELHSTWLALGNWVSVVPVGHGAHAGSCTFQSYQLQLAVTVESQPVTVCQKILNVATLSWIAGSVFMIFFSLFFSFYFLAIGVAGQRHWENMNWKCLIGGCHVWPATKTEIKRWCLLLAMAANDALRLHIIIAATKRVVRSIWKGGRCTPKKIYLMMVKQNMLICKLPPFNLNLFY